MSRIPKATPHGGVTFVRAWIAHLVLYRAGISYLHVLAWVVSLVGLVILALNIG
ncbi:MAG: hypothetical protein AAF689_16880 [Pseudomonadota bacterium]